MPDPTGAERQRLYRERNAGRLAGGRRVPCVCCSRRHTGIYGRHCYRCWLLQTVEGRALAAQRVRDSRAKAKRDKLSTGPIPQT
jgi:hypothetical protein